MKTKEINYCIYCARRTQHRAISFLGGVEIPMCNDCHTSKNRTLIMPHRADQEPELEE